MLQVAAFLTPTAETFESLPFGPILFLPHLLAKFLPGAGTCVPPRGGPRLSVGRAPAHFPLLLPPRPSLGAPLEGEEEILGRAVLTQQLGDPLDSARRESGVQHVFQLGWWIVS